MNVRFIFILLMLVVGLVSCSDELENTSYKYLNNHELDKECIMIYSLSQLDSVFGYEGGSVNVPLNKPLTKTNITPVSENGFNRRSVLQTGKMSLTAAVAEKIGLQPNVVYVVQLEKYEKDISTGGKTFFMAESPNCGAKPVMGAYNEETSDFEVLGYRIVKSGNPTTLSTHLYYFVSTMDGREVNKYYPRSPRNLIWNYYLY